MESSLEKNSYSAASGFDYGEAFNRNLGFLSDSEQQKMRNARIAIAGLGGTGGAQAHALARLGVGAFSIADPDSFELVNFNRQIGATMATLNRQKIEVIAEIIRGINPDADIRSLSSGISEENIAYFLDDVDVVIDSLDFYCFRERFLLYRQARERGLWVLTAPPLGFGFTLLAFEPTGMRFEDYFAFEESMSEADMVAALVAGIAPSRFFLRYLDRHEAGPGRGRLPSVGAAPFMIAGVIGTEVVNLITEKVPPLAVPTVIQYDALLRQYRCRTYRWGMRSPIQRLKRIILRRMLYG